MKTTTVKSLCFLAAASAVAAFPNLQPSNVEVPAPAKVKRQNPSATPPFDAESQLVSTSGLHAWRAPGPLDSRGPCPGLNAMANHGYLPRSGLATITDFITGTRQVFGMAADLSTILAAYGAALDGLGVAWSIGGIQHVGIGGSHNNYETDSSPMRGDLEQYGSNTDLVMSQFMQFYNMQPDAATANYDLSVLRKFRGKRFKESIAKNPNFFYAPFSGTAVSAAAFTFIYRFMSNKTAENPAGVLNKDVLKSFMSISGPENNLKWTPGHERIPDNWYTRNKADRYSLDYLGADSSYLAETQPEIASPGCNMGKVNTFQTINTTALTGSTYTSAEIVADPLCYGLAYATSMTGFLGPVNAVVGELILPIQNSLGCKTIPKLDMSVAQACPGYSLYGGPNSKVVKGAVQD